MVWMIAEEITQKIVNLSRSLQTWPLKPAPHLSSARRELDALTLELINARWAQGAPLSHPFSSIKGKSIPISEQVAEYLHGATVLITGAAGTIGSALSEAVAKFRPAKVLLLDRRPRELSLIHERMFYRWPHLQISKCEVDICSQEELLGVFREHRPQVIYHLAAQREPGSAEKEVSDTICTNILGTQNLALLAGRFGAERFIYASSAKGRFIYESRVYAATKKYAEAIIKMAAHDSLTRFSMVRFHHLVENSIVERVFASQIAKGEPLTVHFPPKTQSCQSLQEAVAMLLNVGVCGANAEIFAVAREVERFSILDLALYSIKASGKPVSIVFKVPSKSDGHQTTEFTGTRRNNHSSCVLHGFNMVETQQVSMCDGLHLEKAAFPDIDHEATQRQIDDILRFTAQPSSSSEAIKERLYLNLSLFATNLYARAPLELVVASFSQGIQDADDNDIYYFAAHKELLTVLVTAIRTHDRAEFSLQDRDTLLQAIQLLDDKISGREGFQDLINAVRLLRTSLSE